MSLAHLAVPVDRFDAGTAPTVLLLHGFPVDHRMWNGLVDSLAEFHVLAVDLPGLGSSSLEDFGEPSLEAAADAVARVIVDKAGSQVVVAGLSMGGYVALALLERHPDLVAGLALLDTKSTIDSEDARANRLRIAQAVEDSDSVEAVRGMRTSVLGATTLSRSPATVDLMDQWIQEQAPSGVAWSQRAMAARPDRTAALRSFAGPSTVIFGAEDPVTPLSEAEHMMAALADGVFVRVPGAGHMSALESPSVVAEAIAQVTRRVGQTS